MARDDRNSASRRSATWRGRDVHPEDRQRFYARDADDFERDWDERAPAYEGRRGPRDDYDGPEYASAEDLNRGRRDLGGPEFTLTRNDRTATSRWNPDANDDGGYFHTGTYIDGGNSSRGFGREFERARARVQRRGDYAVRARERDRATNGPYGDYDDSTFGPSQYARDPYKDERRSAPWQPGQTRDYEHRSSWDYERDAPFSHHYDSSIHGAGSYDAAEARPNTPSFRGRGPRGYTRSDERLREMICEHLTDHPAIDASHVSVEVNDQIVKLTGTVEDRRTKYEMEELIEDFSGVKDVDNQVRVRKRGWQANDGHDWEAGASASSPPRETPRTAQGTKRKN